MPDSAVPTAITAEQAAGVMGSRRFVALLVIVSIVGVIVSFATWGFLELIHQITQELYTHLPHAPAPAVAAPATASAGEHAV